MSAGLPGVGLSGVFFILSALVMVPLEIARTIRGRSSLRRWATVLRHLAIALSMIVCVELAYAVLRMAIERVGPLAPHNHLAPHTGKASGTASTANVFHVLPVAPLLATLGIVAFLLLAAKAAQLLSRWRRTRVLEVAGAHERDWTATTFEVPSTFPEAPSARTAK